MSHRYQKIETRDDDNDVNEDEDEEEEEEEGNKWNIRQTKLVISASLAYVLHCSTHFSFLFLSCASVVSVCFALVSAASL